MKINLLYIPKGRSRLLILQHCHDMPMAKYFGVHKILELVSRNDWCKHLHDSYVEDYIVVISVINIDHIGYSNPYQFLMVRRNPYIWISLLIFHLPKVSMLMDWVESPNKSMSYGATIQEFKRRCGQPSLLKKAMLDSSKVLLVLKLVCTRDKRDLGLFLEKEDGLVSYWGAIERAFGQYKKCNK